MSGPNGQSSRAFTLKDLMEDNKTFNLRGVEDVINRFVDEGKFFINFDLSTSRFQKYDLNPMYEMISTLEETKKHQSSSDPIN